ncbi:hypothetical protein TWF281_003091 [Arthrobotrys megalospora]
MPRLQSSRQGPAVTPESCKFCKAASASKGYSAILHCCVCDEFFIQENTYNSHNARVHRGKARALPTAPFECLDCQKGFYDEVVFNSHLAQHEVVREHTNYSAQKGVPTNPKTKKIFICPDCGRDFASRKLRKEHQCPALYRCPSDKCHKSFRMLRGLVDHLESGNCKSGLTRDTINRLICEKDTKGLITVPGALQLLGRPDTSDYDLEDDMASLSLDDSSWGVLTPEPNGSEISFEMLSNDGHEFDDNFDVISLASDYSRLTPGSSGSSVIVTEPIKPTQCYICRKVFRKAFDLRQHLESAVHSPKLYHCQLSFIGLEPIGKIKQFKTLGGLVAHIETGGCRGGNTTFEIAVSMLGRLAEEFGFPGMDKAVKQIGGRLHSHC